MHTMSYIVYFIIAAFYSYLASCRPLAETSHFPSSHTLDSRLHRLTDDNQEDIAAVQRAWETLQSQRNRLRDHRLHSVSPQLSNSRFAWRPVQRKRQLPGSMSVNQDLGAIAGMLRTASHRWQQRQLQNIKAKLNRIGKRGDIDEASGLDPVDIFNGDLDTVSSAMHGPDSIFSNWNSAPTLSTEVRQMKEKSTAALRGHLRNGGDHSETDKHEQKQEDEQSSSGNSETPHAAMKHSHHSQRNPRTRGAQSSHSAQGLAKRSSSPVEALLAMLKQSSPAQKQLIQERIRVLTKRLETGTSDSATGTQQPILTQRRQLSVNGALHAISDMLSAHRARQRLTAEERLHNLG
ncbi:uncharacterized protein LOC106178996 [Lingula anatina]|uniref:Uncharacterized protein LOC106178996 n=1 Tax=Lingula anatina TaxID=7574 RepID=A0A1S3K6L9_LINAN|nr:uncharacterized protein LOC106178996 [Lingula anatina]XP_013417900.1 uncharacterized protein LOC106178996 [Lingula anatina]XP_013417901.1 uncharacterized protein LOC106178996 [Lingula anatina]|eukprot:XP_013417899.1 uncharacterized protein LOC106178996 [Lingula anatina]